MNHQALQQCSPASAVGQPRCGAARTLSAGRLRQRLWGLLAALPCLALLLTAFHLHPARGGHGTHQQMGLPACTYLAETGWPCPTCGLTTSVSAAVHGRFGLAFKAHAFGPVIVAAAAALAVAGTVQAATGRALLSRLRPRWTWGAMALAGLLAGWGLKCLTGWLAGTLPS